MQDQMLDQQPVSQANANPNDFRFEVDVNVINHLGVGLYSSTPAALTELVANAWDAEATRVEITIDAAANKIVIEDNGHGMNAASIKAKFLNVGYSRRVNSANKHMSENNQRRVMGRKGIGKLSMFALSDFVRVSSQARGENPVGFEVDVPTLKSDLQSGQKTPLTEFMPAAFPDGHGTRIELTSVLKTLNRTESYLRVKLARRFSILGGAHNFQVLLNGTEITEKDRAFFHSVQFLWGLDKETLSRISALSENLAKTGDGPEETKTSCTQLLDNMVSLQDGTQVQVTGYIASVFRPRDLGSKDDSANMISVFANGRVFAENVLSEVNSAKYYQSYLVGEVHADFLDDDETDRATASREAIKRDDPKYKALVGFIVRTVETIGDIWDEWRTDQGLDKGVPANQAVTDWLASIEDKRDLTTAKRLMTSIQNATVHSDEAKNEAAKGVLYKGAIIGFEKLRIKKQLDKLSEITNVLGPEFAAIFSNLNDVEEASYADITKQRLEIIKKFKDIAGSDDALEKVAQQYLFKHLWLLDPSWDRVSGRATLEENLTAHIKKADPDSTGARLDISYRASSGRHIVVELKRPKIRNFRYIDLYDQARKYKNAVEQYYRDTRPNDPPPPLDIYLLISQTPAEFTESDRRSLAEQNAKIITYRKLIDDANNAYQEYLDVNTKTSPLQGVLDRL
ncbi:ATP-binding protein [Agrobacterium tumefaciens]|uniref:BbrUII/HgiDII family restriction enzyme n=1 Tax=Agrobacterium tumefaciens TaxID=358 RepID=UPI001BB77907|nr:ATP-binding protein [Agrobacterium tumefaciens]